MSLRNMKNQIILRFCGEIGALGAIKSTSRTLRFVTIRIRLCSVGTTIVVSNLFSASDRKQIKMRSLTEQSETNVKIQSV